ncbi:ADP-ribosylglycohydrolase family protein [Candidatus Pacearchaeota archaeon]|nr:ADP-ribosylglycohydrolase family protein [Candidatus Pacearchaeota archaeon]
MRTNNISAALIGLSVGDALGVPVEFMTREELEENPVTGMIGNGTHSQPKGTWSDDSSLAFCLTESLCQNFNLNSIGQKFYGWACNAYWTAHDEVFDIGNVTIRAMTKLEKGRDSKLSGSTEERSNGNGSLMRALPLAFYTQDMDEKRFELAEQVSAITHAHPISKIACAFYNDLAINLIKDQKPLQAYENAIKSTKNYYKNKSEKEFLSSFQRTFNKEIPTLSRKEINSGGYVVDTLEASIWCLLNSKNYKDAVLKAVNLGSDTDTTATVTGGLAGIVFGYDNIPKEWINTLARKEDILALAKKYKQSLDRK